MIILLVELQQLLLLVLLELLVLVHLLVLSLLRHVTPLDFAIEFVEESVGGAIDRLGIDERTLPVLGVGLPHIQVQLRPGRDVATIVEVAARNQMLKRRGVHSARRFVAGVAKRARTGRP